MKTFSQGTDTWKKVTQGMSISAYSPVCETAAPQAAPSRQGAPKGENIPVPTSDGFLGDLKKASRNNSHQ
jgi:hypothetical protein